jgi:hypothetical protein
MDGATFCFNGNGRVQLSQITFYLVRRYVYWHVE